MDHTDLVSRSETATLRGRVKWFAEYAIAAQRLRFIERAGVFALETTCALRTVYSVLAYPLSAHRHARGKPRG